MVFSNWKQHIKGGLKAKPVQRTHKDLPGKSCWIREFFCEGRAPGKTGSGRRGRVSLVEATETESGSQVAACGDRKRAVAGDRSSNPG